MSLVWPLASRDVPGERGRLSSCIWNLGFFPNDAWKNCHFVPLICGLVFLTTVWMEDAGPLPPPDAVRLLGSYGPLLDSALRPRDRDFFVQGGPYHPQSEWKESLT